MNKSVKESEEFDESEFIDLGSSEPKVDESATEEVKEAPTETEPQEAEPKEEEQASSETEEKAESEEKQDETEKQPVDSSKDNKAFPSGSQRRINRLTKKVKNYESELDQLRREKEEYAKFIESQKPQEQKEETLADVEARLRNEFEQQGKRNAYEQQQQAEAKVMQERLGRLSEEDRATIEGADIQLDDKPNTLQMLRTHEKGMDLALAMAKNEQLADMVEGANSDGEAIGILNYYASTELGKAKEPIKPVAKATPKPIPEVSTSKGSSGKDLGSLSDEEFAKKMGII